MAVSKTMDFNINLEAKNNMSNSLDAISQSISDLIEVYDKSIQSIKQAVKEYISNKEAIKSTKEAYESTYKAIHKFDESVLQSSTSIQKFSNQMNFSISGIGNFTKLITNLVIELDRLTKPETLKRTSDLFAIFAAMTKLRGFDQLSSGIYKVSLAINSLSKKSSDLRSSLTGDFGDTSLKARMYMGDTSASVEYLKNSIVDLSGTMVSATKSVFDYAKSFIQVTTNITMTAQALNTLVTPENAKNISNIFAVLSAGSEIKGFDNVSKQLMMISDSSRNASIQLQDMKDKQESLTSRLEQAANASRLYVSAISMLKTIGIAAVIGTATGFLYRFAKTTEYGNNLINNWISSFNIYVDIFKTFSKTLYETSPAISKLMIMLVELSSGFSLLGNYLSSSDDKFTQFIGNIFRNSALTGFAIGAVLNITLRTIGDGLASIGKMLDESMTKFEEKFTKSQNVMSQFQFVINGLTRDLGEATTGGLEMWNKKLVEMQDTTKFATVDIAKSMKMIISEGARFGLTTEQISNLITKSGDIASSYSMDVVDSANMITNALAGQTQSFVNLGISVNDAANAHSDLFLMMGKSSDKLTKQEQALVKYDLIMKETSSIIGAATNELNTIAGATAKYERAVVNVQVKMGTMAFIAENLIAAKTKLFEILNKLPNSFYIVAGSVQDLLSFFLPVIGVVIKFGTYILAATTVMKLFNAYAASTVISNTALGRSILFVANSLNVQTIAMTGSKELLINLGNILKGAMSLSLVAFTALLNQAKLALISFSKVIWSTTIAVLSNPLFWKVAIIVGSIIAVIEAMKQLYEQVDFVREGIDNLKKEFIGLFSSLDKNVSSLSSISNIFMELTQNILGITKIIVGGFVAGIYSLSSAYSFLRGVLSTDEKEQEEWNNKAEDARDKIIQLSKFMSKASDEVTLLGGKTAYAATQMSVADKNAKKYSDTLEKLVSFQMKDFNEESERLKITGNEFKQALEKQEEAIRNLTKARQENLEIEDKAKGIAEAQKELIKANMEVEKLSNDTIKKIREDSLKARIEELKKSEKVVESIKLENKEKLRLFDEQINNLKTLGSLTKKQQDDINEARKNIVNSGLAEVESEQNKKALEDYNKIKNSKENLLESIKKENLDQISSIEGVRELRLKEIEDNRKILRDKGILNNERKKELDLVESLVNKNSDLEKNKALLEQQKASTEILVENKKMIIDMNKDQLAKIDIIDVENQLLLDQIDIKMLDNKLSVESMRLLQQQKDLIKQKGEKDKSLITIDEVISRRVDIIVGKNDLNKEMYKSALEFSMQISDAINIGSRKGFSEISSYILDAAKFAYNIFDKTFITPIKDLYEGLSTGETNFTGIKDSIKLGSEIFLNNQLTVVEKIGLAFTSGTSLISSTLQTAGAALNAVLTGKPLDFMASILETINNLPENLMKILDRFDSVISSLLDKFPQMVTKLIQRLPEVFKKLFDALPKIVDNIAKSLPILVKTIVDMLPEMIKKVGAELPKLLSAIFDGIIAIIDRLPDIIDSLLEALPKFIEMFFQKLPELFRSIFRAIPKIIVSILENLPDILESLISGIIGAVGEIVTAFVDEFLLKGGLEKIIVGIIKAVPRIAVALVHGILTGLLRGIKSFGNLFGGKIKLPEEITNLPEKISEGAKKLGTDIGKSVSQVFSVKDLNENAKNLDIGEKMSSAINGAITNFSNATQNSMNLFINGLKAAWQWVLDNIWNPIFNSIKTVWLWVYDNVLKPIWDGLLGIWQWVNDSVITPMIIAIQSVWQWVNDKVITPVVSALTTLWTWVKEKILDPIVSAFQSTFQFIGDKVFNPIVKAFDTIFTFLGEKVLAPMVKTLGSIFDPLTKAFNSLGKIFEPITKAFNSLGKIFEPITKVFSDLGKSLESITKPFDQLSKSLSSFSGGGISNITGGGGGGNTVTNAISSVGKSLGFANGGLVYAAEGQYINFKPRGTDTVPAMLTQGEYVVKRDAVKSLGLSTMNSINSGVLPSSGSSIVIQKIEINAKTNLDADGIRREVIPAIEKHLLKKSQEGQRIIDPKGVRI